LFETAKELEKEGYKPQLNLPFENANLFLLLEGERRKLVREKEVFRLVGKKETFEKGELLSLVEVTPNLFVTNVALRPLLQDFLLPTVAYVGGASEITYFAEISKLYEIFEISMPVIFPRNSVLLLEKRISRLLEKSGLILEDCFVSEKVLLEKVLGKLGKTPNELFFEFEKNLNSDFEALKTQLTEIDFVLKDVSEKAFEKILHQLSLLSQKAESSFRTKNENIVSQVSKVSSAIFPDFSAQERKLGILTFYNKYGLDLCEKILPELEPFKFEIQVFELKNQ
ncbi:bacillithiol biosynthesis BshC, partial [bacterium]|nr:bacillithiol biosynthesis BshC [bacterium]